MTITGPAHALEKGQSNRCGIALNDSEEARVVAEVMRDKPGVQITEYPALILIEGEDRLEFDMQEISDALGREMDPYFFQVQMTTHYGRLVLQDDRLLLFARPEDAMEYTGLQLSEAETGKTEKQG